MLLDDKQVAINDLVVAWQESADLYLDAAGQVDAPALQALFADIATERRDGAERLATVIRDGGELPRAPYADREELHKLVTHVKAAFSADDGRQVFLDDRIEGERRLEDLLAKALRLDFAEDTRALLETLRAEVGDVVARLGDVPGDGRD